MEQVAGLGHLTLEAAVVALHLIAAGVEAGHLPVVGHLVEPELVLHGLQKTRQFRWKWGC